MNICLLFCAVTTHYWHIIIEFIFDRYEQKLNSLDIFYGRRRDASFFEIRSVVTEMKHAREETEKTSHIMC
jgi:hypothetical protein